MVATNYSYGIERDEEVLKKNGLDHTKWTNPLEVQCVFSINTQCVLLTVECCVGFPTHLRRKYSVCTDTGKKLRYLPALLSTFQC